MAEEQNDKRHSSPDVEAANATALRQSSHCNALHAQPCDLEACNLARAWIGKVTTPSHVAPKDCPTCGGDGKLTDQPGTFKACSTCGGCGKVVPFGNRQIRADYAPSTTPQKRLAAWVDGVCKTCGQYTHSCKCEHPGRDFMKRLFAAPQEGAGSPAGPATNGEPAAAASWLDTIPTAADGVTCHIRDVRRAFALSATACRLTGFEHDLRCWPDFFEEVYTERKPFEIRQDDRHYQVGDTLLLREWAPGQDKYTGRECKRVVTYMTNYHQREGYVVLGLRRADGGKA